MPSDVENPISPVLAFTESEANAVQRMLEKLVRALREVPGGGKIEEGYWSYIYHTVRDAPIGTWSNLTMRDFCYAGLGVEMKLLRRRSPIAEQGHSLMHPAATRTIAFNPLLDAETCKIQILEQFASQIREFRSRVSETCLDCQPDIRWGIFLWSPKLDEFLYFEETIKEPDPNDFVAQFIEGKHRGKPTRNLHIFEKGTGIKRFSVTMPAKGAKLQPYFDVPLVDEGAYTFRIPNDGRKAIWLKNETIDAIQKASKNYDQDMDNLIISALRALVGP